MNSLAQAGATREALTKAHIENFEVLLPGKSLMSVFKEKIGDLANMQFQLAEEIATLELTREALLPKLLSGELPTSEIPSVSPFSKGSALRQKTELIEGSPPLQKGEQGGFTQQNRQPTPRTNP